MLNRRSFLKAMGAAAAVLTMPLAWPRLPRWFGKKPLVVVGDGETTYLQLAEWDHVIVRAGGRLVLDGASIKRLDVYGIVSGTAKAIGALNLYDSGCVGFAEAGTRTYLDCGTSQTTLRVFDPARSL